MARQGRDRLEESKKAKSLKKLFSLRKTLENRRQSANEISKIKNLLKKKIEEKKVLDAEVMGVLERDILSLSGWIELKKKKTGPLVKILGWKVRDDSFPDEIYVDFQITAILMFGGSINIEKDVIGGFEKTIELPKIQEKIRLLNKTYKTQFIIGCEAKRR